MQNLTPSSIIALLGILFCFALSPVAAQTPSRQVERFSTSTSTWLSATAGNGTTTEVVAVRNGAGGGKTWWEWNVADALYRVQKANMPVEDSTGNEAYILNKAAANDKKVRFRVQSGKLTEVAGTGKSD